MVVLVVSVVVVINNVVEDTALKQNSWDTERVWWVPVLVRGKLHVELLPAAFPGETPEGAAIMVAMIPRILNARFPNAAKPRIVFTDRGRGFYHPSTGTITDEYREALRAHGLRPFAGEDASAQPGNISDVLLHETAVAWLRHLLCRSLPAQPWKESREDFATRICQAARHVNADYEVNDLCNEFPERLQELVDLQGDKLRK